MFESAKRWCQEVLSGEPAPVSATAPGVAEPSSAPPEPPRTSMVVRFLPAGALDGLRRPGPGARTVVAEPVADLPAKIAPAPSVEATLEPTQEPINWDDERREDLSVRTPE